jgi:type I restriction enzyme M protein
MNIQQLEDELWEAADQLRANSKLTASEYSMPVLGLIFLRHADNCYKVFLPEIVADIPRQVPAAQREELIKLGFKGKAGAYDADEISLKANAVFAHIYTTGLGDGAPVYH